MFLYLIRLHICSHFSRTDSSEMSNKSKINRKYWYLQMYLLLNHPLKELYQLRNSQVYMSYPHYRSRLNFKISYCFVDTDTQCLPCERWYYYASSSHRTQTTTCFPAAYSTLGSCHRTVK